LWNRWLSDAAINGNLVRPSLATKGRGVLQFEPEVTVAYLEGVEVFLQCCSQRLQLTLSNRGRVGNGQFGGAGDVTGEGKTTVSKLRFERKIIRIFIPTIRAPRSDLRVEAVFVVCQILRQLIGNGEVGAICVPVSVDGQRVVDGGIKNVLIN